VTGKRASGVDTAVQHFRSIPDAAIEQLIKGPAMYCAGGFAVEEMTEWDAGCDGDQTTVLGLPLPLTRQLLDILDSAV
jgi:predicted house-cleaning NTP pyrophosphatase (Maf/HAM1 superfamily)